ncbi:MAG: polysaccharide biosynthesis C-terminal domain-containing protein [Chloroflexi bacterium]|nr:polysaccharide biosynthesis C-terminal domain-containing protein [Chloroflexota bacterium]MBU1751412.1 polysaccharide biosynthesis C-terminal domain-containing protein [Chloroflexota bacterium]
MEQDTGAANEQTRPGSTLVKPVAILMIAQVLDKGLYLAREMLVSAFFGLSGLTDAFNVGLYVSNLALVLLRPLIEDTFIPVYIARLARDRDDAQRMLETVALLIVLVTGAVVTGVNVFAPQVVSFVAPGFAPETADLTVQIVRVMTVYTLILALTNFALSVLTAHRAFLLVGLSPLAATVVVIAMIAVFAGTLSIQSLTWGLVLGTLVQLGILAVGLWRRRLAPRGPRLDLRFREVWGALGAFTLLMFLVRLVNMSLGWVDRNLGSQLAEGSLAALSFATNIFQLPFQICVLAVTTVAIAQFSWRVAEDDMTGLKRDLALALRIAAFFLIPATVGLVALHQPVVRLLYERGAFGAQDTAITASALLAYAVGLVPQAIVFIAVRLFLARKEAHLILLIVVAGALVHVLVDLTAIGPMKQAGIALALSANATVMAVTSLLLARWKLGPLGGRLILVAFAKISTAAVGMGLTVYALLFLAAGWPTLWSVLVCVVVGAGVYVALAYVLRLSELRLLLAAVGGRVGLRGWRWT